VQEAIDEVVELWRTGAVKPLVGATYPLEQAAEAHRLVEERRSVGKVVLVP
jgi:NADPH2:quinone reductase